MFFKNTPPQNLEEWLKIATGKLSLSAKQRIQLEIEGHYAEAVVAHENKGASKMGAQAMALADLGDAWAARRRFRKRYLVAWEARHLDGLLDRKRMKQFLVINYTMFACFALCYIGLICVSINTPFLNSCLSAQIPTLILELFAMVVLPTISFRLLKKRPSYTKTWNIVYLESFGGLYLGFLINALSSFKGTSVLEWIGLVGFSLVYLFNVSLGLHISRKLREA